MVDDNRYYVHRFCFICIKRAAYVWNNELIRFGILLSLLRIITRLTAEKTLAYMHGIGEGIMELVSQASIFFDGPKRGKLELHCL